MRDWFLHKLYQLKLRKTSPYMSDFRKILLPMIRRVMPTVIAHDLMNVQPMTGEVGKIFTLKAVTHEQIEELAKEGATRHVFGRGWERFYGGEWISDDLYWKLKIKGVI